MKKGSESKASGSVPEKGEPRFVVASMPSGVILGRTVKSSKKGVIVIELEDGTQIECPRDAKLSTAADPALFTPRAFDVPSASDSAARLDELLTLFRDEAKTAEERRAWANLPLPDGKEFDELIRFRYEAYKSEWVAALRVLLATEADNGNERPLLLALEQGVPTDARRVAAEVAVSQMVRSAIPALCAAAIHKTQASFARVAAEALAVLGPERLPLIAASVARGDANAIDLSAPAKLPEAQAIQVALSVPSSGVSDALAGVTATRADLDVAILLHLTFALPVVQQIRLLASETPFAARTAVREQLRNLFQPIAEKESPTTYELLLRTASAQLILADTVSGCSRDLRATAARSFVRDADSTALRDVVLAVCDDSAVQLVHAALGASRAERAAEVLNTIASARSDLALRLGPTLRSRVRAADLDESVRIASLKVLAADPSAHDLVATEVSRDLGWGSAPGLDNMAHVVVQHGVVFDLNRVRPAGRIQLLQALKDGKPSYAAAFLQQLYNVAADELSWTALNALELPDAWVRQEPALRDALLAWLPLAATFGSTTHTLAVLVESLKLGVADAWLTWDAEHQHAALSVLSQAPAELAADILASLAATLDPADNSRRSILRCLVSEVIVREPKSAVIAVVSLGEEELQRALLAHGVTTEAAISEWHAANERSATDANASLARDLNFELDRALQAVGRDDVFGVLFARLADIAAVAARRVEDAEPLVEEYLSTFGTASSTDGGGEHYSEALSVSLKHVGTQGRLSQSAVAFFHARAVEILGAMPDAALDTFVVQRRQMLDRLRSSAVELVAVEILSRHGRAHAAWELVSAGSTPSTAVGIAMRAGGRNFDAALALLNEVGVTINVLAIAIAARTSQHRELVSSTASATGALAAFARQLAPTLEAIEGLVLNYMRIRRVLMAHGLAPIEPVLGNLRDSRALVQGEHRVVGLDVTAGRYEVLTQGIRRVDSGLVIVPASVARTSEADAPVEQRSNKT